MKKPVGIVAISNPMKSRLLHDLIGIQKIERDVTNAVDSNEFKKQINSKPRRKR